MPEYRKRILERYVGSRNEPLAPASAEELDSGGWWYLWHLVGPHFPADRAARILDIGCGYGGILHFARKAGYANVEGIDASTEQVAAAARLGIPGVRLGDLIPYLAGFPEAALDAVVAFDVVEHFRKDELVPLVDAVLRVLKPGGRWIVHTPNGEALFSGRSFHWDFTHEVCFTRASIAQLLLASGFSSVACYEDRPAPRTPFGAVRLALWHLVRLALTLLLVIEGGRNIGSPIFSQNFLTIAVK